MASTVGTSDKKRKGASLIMKCWQYSGLKVQCKGSGLRDSLTRLKARVDVLKLSSD